MTSYSPRLLRAATSLAAAALLLATPLRALASCGTVEVSKGDVKITSGTTKQQAAAPVGSKICSGDTIVAGADSRAKLKMEDGNELNISPDSKIVIENYQYNPTANKKKVLLNVLQGKVRATTKQENMYNDKAKDGQANTFEVRTKTAVAGVRGTDFLTSYNPSNQKSEVITFRGKVSFGQLGANGAVLNAVSVVAGQKTEISAGQAPAAPVVVPAKELEKSNTETKSDAGVVKTGASAGASTGASTGTSGGSSTSTSSSDAKSSDAKSGDVKTGDAKSGDAASRGTASTTASGSSSPAGTANSSPVGSTSAPTAGGAGSSTNVSTPTTPTTSTATTVTSSMPSTAPPTIVTPPAPPALPPVPPTLLIPAIPKCDICTAAQETNKSSKVNITIRIKN